MLIRPPVLPMALELYDTSASRAVSTTQDSVLILPTKQVAVGGLDYDTETGEITIPLPGIYSLQMTLNPVGGVTTNFWFYASLNSGSGYVNHPTSGRRARVTGAFETQILMSSESYFPAPLKLRFHLWVSDAINLNTTSVPGESGVSTPAIRILITGR